MRPDMAMKAIGLKLGRLEQVIYECLEKPLTIPDIYRCVEQRVSKTFSNDEILRALLNLERNGFIEMYMDYDVVSKRIVFGYRRLV